MRGIFGEDGGNANLFFLDMEEEPKHQLQHHAQPHQPPPTQHRKKSSSSSTSSYSASGAEPATSSTQEGSPTPKKHCQICTEDIVKFKGLHYGAMTCYSCRAFFRRCHSADRKEPFKALCKNNVSKSYFTPHGSLYRSYESVSRCSETSFSYYALKSQ